MVRRLELRVVFMGSPELAIPSLERLILAGHDIAAVYTQPDRPAGRGRTAVPSPVKRLALERGLTVVQPENLKTDEAVSHLADFRPDVIVVCAFGQILTQAILDVPPLQCINVHFSLLPRHRGSSPVAAAILAGDEFTGVSIQLVRLKLDTGPVLAAAAVSISPRDDTGTLNGKLAVVGAHLLDEALLGWVRHEREPQPQDEARATYFSRITKQEGQIDWQRPAVEIWLRVRAYSPWPCSYTFWRGRQIKIIEVVPLPDYNNTEPGLVVSLSGPEAVMGVGTGKGILGLLAVQIEGGKAMSAADFLRGHRQFLGDRLAS
jgi:methionyl-tRNA formyltransferase